MKLYVIRHGETILNVKDLINGWNSVGLNKNGKEQAKRASEEIAKVDIDVIICSPLRRTVQTCKLINKNNIKVIYDRRIMERNAGSMQFKSDKNIDVNVWYDVDKEVIYKNTEGFKKMLNRVSLFIEEIKVKYENKCVLLVTHGDLSKAIRVYLSGETDPSKIKAMKHKNCEILEYDV